MATRKKSTGGDGPAVFNPASIYINVLNQVDKAVGDTSDNMEDIQLLSSGCAVHDLVIGGGFYPGMYTNSGYEQSGKTTVAVTAMMSAVKAQLPLISFWDAEGSTRNSVPWLLDIASVAGVKTTREQLFGKKDNLGKWISRGSIHYSTVNRGTVFYDWMAATIRRLPDKVRINGNWYLKYPKEKQFAHFMQYHDTSLRYTDGIYIPSDDKLAGLVIMDSWGNLNPDSKNEDDNNQGLGAQARMHSENLQRFKGLLASKKVALLGVNHLSEIPMAMFGPKEKEKGGNDLRSKSDVRTRFTKRALSGAPLWPVESKTNRGYEVERSVDGGVDVYEYMHMRTIKNKLAPGPREGWMRIWKRDSNGKSHGIDPVFDTISYLQMTDQLLGRGGRKKLALQLHKLMPKPIPVDWMDLKRWVLCDRKVMAELSRKYGMTRPVDLRAYIFKQLADGVGEDLYSKAVSAASSGADEKITIVE